MNKTIRHYAGIWSLYLLMVIGVTWPLLLHFRTEVPGHPWLSVKIHVWQFWWTREALLQPEWSLFHTPLLYFPDGFNTLTEMGNFLAPLLSVPWQCLLGLAGGYNAVILGLFAAAGTAVYALCRRFGIEGLASFVGGAAFTFLPYAWMKVFDAELEIAILFWIPVSFIQLDRCIQRPSPARGLGLGLILFLTAMTSWYYGFFLGVSVLLAALVLVVLRRRAGTLRSSETRRLLSVLGMAMAVYGLLMLPFVAQLRQTERVRDLDWRTEAREWDLADKANPGLLELVAPWQRAPSDPQLRAAAREGIPYPFALFPGFVTILLALCGLAHYKKVPAWLWTPALFFWVLSLGPWLKVAGTSRLVSVPLPAYLLASWSKGFAAITIHSYRAAVLLLLGVSVLAALGFAWVARRLALPRRSRRALAGLAVLLMAFDALDGGGLSRPIRRTGVRLPGVYDTLRARRGGGAVLNIPVTEVDQVAADYLLAQTRHRRPIVTGRGYASRLPGAWGALLDGLRYRDDGDAGDDGAPPVNAAGLAARGIRFFVVHGRWMSERRTKAIGEELARHCVPLAVDRERKITIYEFTEGD